MARARDLIFFGYSGAPEPTGTKERDGSFFQVAQTLKLHLERRFADDTIEVVCAWNKDVIVNALRAPAADPSLKIRQIHYCGHGAGGGLYPGYHNEVAKAARGDVIRLFSAWPAAALPDGVKRFVALQAESALISGFFSDALPASKLADVKKRLAPDALMHVWGCFAGAPSHTFETADAYWNLFNNGGPAIEGVARHIARTLEIRVTACRDPGGVHGMDFCHRDAAGAMNCSDKRPDRLPQWLWPESPKVRWITWDPAGASDEKTINFLGSPLAATAIPPGRPPGWLLKEIPVAVAKAKPAAVPACSAARVGF
jgi:hypothetical protein